MSDPLTKLLHENLVQTKEVLDEMGALRSELGAVGDEANRAIVLGENLRDRSDALLERVSSLEGRLTALDSAPAAGVALDAAAVKAEVLASIQAELAPPPLIAPEPPSTPINPVQPMLVTHVIEPFWAMVRTIVEGVIAYTRTPGGQLVIVLLTVAALVWVGFEVRGAGVDVTLGGAEAATDDKDDGGTSSDDDDAAEGDAIGGR